MSTTQQKMSPIMVRRPNRPPFSKMSLQELFDWHRERKEGAADAPKVEYTPPPSMTQADYEREVYAMVNAGAIRQEGADKLLYYWARNHSKGEGPLPEAPPDPQQEAAQRRAALEDALLKAGIPEQFWGLRLNQNPFLTEAGAPFSFDPDPDNSNKRAFVACRKLAASWQPGAKGLTLRSDGVGVGKTLLCYAALVYITAHHKGRDANRRAQVASVKAKDVLYYLRESYGATWEKKPGVMSTEMVRQRYQFRPDVLLIDDLGKEIVRSGEAGEWARAELLEMLDYRMDHKLTTLITTNLTGQEMGERYGAAFASRALGRSPLYEMSGPDYRQSGFEDDGADPFAD